MPYPIAYTYIQKVVCIMVDSILGIFALVLGLFFGNFGTSFYYRIANGVPINGLESWRGTPPHCASCKHPLRYYEYFPIFNWFSVRGNCCNYCGIKIDSIYHIFELGTGIMALIAYCAIGFTSRYTAILLLAILVMLAGFLFYRQVALPAAITIVMGSIGLLDNWLCHDSTISHIIALALFGMLLLVRPVRNTSSHKKQMDIVYIYVEIACIMGIWLPLYIAFPLITLIYCLHNQHSSLYRYLYFITLLPTWLFAIL